MTALTEPQAVWMALIVAQFVVNLPFVAYLILHRKQPMPDFTALNTATGELTATVTRVETLVASQNDASVQASIDAATQSVAAANTALTNLAPIPTPTPA